RIREQHFGLRRQITLADRGGRGLQPVEVALALRQWGARLLGGWRAPCVKRAARGAAHRLKQLLFVEDQVLRMRGGQLVDVLQRDGAGGAGLFAVTTEDAAQEVHVEDASIALARRDTLLCGVLLSLDVDGVRRAGPRAEVAANTAFQTAGVAV